MLELREVGAMPATSRLGGATNNGHGYEPPAPEPEDEELPVGELGREVDPVPPVVLAEPVAPRPFHGLADPTPNPVFDPPDLP